MSGIGASTVVVELLDKYRNNRKIHSYIWNPDFRDNVNIFRWNLSIQRKECERVIYGDSFEESCRHSSYYCSIYDIHDDANRARVFAIYRLLYEVYLESIRTLCLFRKVFTESSISRWFFSKWSFSCASDFSHIKRGYTQVFFVESSAHIQELEEVTGISTGSRHDSSALSSFYF